MVLKSAESIFSAYPRKVARKPALQAITKALKKNAADYLLERTTAYAAAVAGKEPQFIPHPATWFNQERFNDDPQEWEPTANANQPTEPGTASNTNCHAGEMEGLPDNRYASRGGFYRRLEECWPCNRRRISAREKSAVRQQASNVQSNEQRNARNPCKLSDFQHFPADNNGQDNGIATGQQQANND